MVNNAQNFIDKVTAAPDAVFDAADVATAKTDAREIVEKAKLLAQAEREELKREIKQAALEVGSTPEDKQSLEALATEIEAIDAPKTVAPPQESAIPDALTDMIPEPLQKMLGMGESGARGAMKGIGGVFNSMKSGTIFGIASMFEFFDSPFMKGIANWLRGFAEPGAIREAMEKTLKAKVEKTPEDKGHTETLRTQYQMKLDADKKDAKVYSFETFYVQKIAELAKAGLKASYTLADLANIPSAEQRAAEEASATELAEKAAKRVEEEKKKESEKKLKEDPEARKTAYVVALAQAINDVADGFITINNTDLTKANRDALVAELHNKLSGERAVSTLGIDIDGGDLEEADGTNWFYDPDKATYFESNLKDYPDVAIRDLLAATFDGGRSKTIMPQVQAKLRERLTALGINSDAIAPPAPVADAPTEEPADKA